MEYITRLNDLYPYCESCKCNHGRNGPDWKFDCLENPYGWPYSNKCPECGARAMVDGRCTACGEDQHQEKCPECGTWQNHRYFSKPDWGGCVVCAPRKRQEEEQRRMHEAYERDEREHRNRLGNEAIATGKLIEQLQKIQLEHGDLPVYAEVDLDWIDTMAGATLEYSELRGYYVNLA